MNKDSMKAKFTKASKNDGTLVTVNLNQFVEYGLETTFKKGSQLIITVNGVPTLFYINRKTKTQITAATHCFPRSIRLPNVGKPVFASVNNIDCVQKLK